MCAAPCRNQHATGRTAHGPSILTRIRESHDLRLTETGEGCGEQIFLVLSLSTLSYWQSRNADKSQYGTCTTVLSAGIPLHMLMYVIPLRVRAPPAPPLRVYVRAQGGGMSTCSKAGTRARPCATRARFPHSPCSNTWYSSTGDRLACTGSWVRVGKCAAGALGGPCALFCHLP